MFFRLTTLYIAVLFTNFSFGQTQDVLKFAGRPYYSEKASLVSGKTYTITHLLCYDQPQWVDDEHCYDLRIFILDSLRATTFKTLDLKADTSIIRWQFRFKSPWIGLLDNKPEISGQISILSWTMNSIKINFDFTIYATNNKRRYIYKGARTFISQH